MSDGFLLNVPMQVHSAGAASPAGQAGSDGGRRASRPEALGRAALLVIDMQQGFDDSVWGARNAPEAEANVAWLLAAWRAAGAPVIHIHHDSPGSGGLLRRGTPGHAPKPQARPAEGEKVYRKRVNSAFIGTSLEADLKRLGIGTVAIVGLTTNHCVSTTARMAANLGFRTLVVADATAAFAGTHVDGRPRSAEDIHQGALSDLHREFAEIVDTATLISAITRQKGRTNA